MTRFLALLLASISLTTVAIAQEATKADTNTEAAVDRPENPKFSPVMPVKIKPRQGGADSISKAAADVELDNAINPDSLGLLTTLSSGGFGDRVWQGFDSEALASQLAQLNINGLSYVTHDLTRRVLLSSPSNDQFPNDKSTFAAFSTRMELLTNIGAYDEALQLYKKLEGNIPANKVALAGVRSMIANNQLGLACLEEKALATELRNDDSTSFWDNLNSFCQLLLENDNEAETDSLAKVSLLYVAKHQSKAPASLPDLNDKSLVEVLTLYKAGQIAKSLYSYETAKTLKPSMIAFLLKQSPTSPEERLSLMAAAIDKGLKPMQDLQAEYISQLAAIPSITEPTWKDILSHYAKIQASTTDVEKVESLKTLLKGKDRTLLLPFGAHFASLKNTESFTQNDARKVISLLILSKNAVSGAWFAKAFDKPEAATKESMKDLDVISALEDNNKDMSDAESDVKGKKQPLNKKSDKSPQAIEKAQLYAISLILSSKEDEDKPRDTSYDNVFNLTGFTDYVMPSMELMNNLTRAASAQDTGKVVLYSLQILNGHRASQLHPSALYRIMKSLQSAGLSEEVRSLAHEVLADLIKDKE